ncbi:phosphate acetyl/butaryl transferase [Legionella beliardensis]|uniref:Phosphate acetyltransferase n=1 Tax=Legionella beliardensis TaxID=91822 RepID=A0A378I9R5_9GAMM|nr:phosphate acetyltransferase [Legionella beliardensis]STX29114.1 phosphate acetyl/butaryl transferase [Legionella beliardensis]
MHKKIYLSGIEKRPGKSFTSLGIVALLQKHFSLRCVKLFQELDNEQNSLLKTIVNKTISPVMEITQAITMMRNAPDDLFSVIFEKIKDNKNDEITYIEGSDFESDNDVFEYEFNLTIATQLNCEILLTVSAKDRTLNHTLSVIATALDISKRNHAQVIGIIVNRVALKDEVKAYELFTNQFPQLAFIIIPEFDDLANPSMGDIANKLNASIICGKDELQRRVKQFTVAAKTIGNFLESRLEREGMLIITPGDRIDILLGSLLADQSSFYPKIAGIVLTGGDIPGKTIRQIISGLEHPFPVLLTSHKTYETATLLFSSKFSLNKDNLTKVNTAIAAMETYLSQPLLKLISETQQISGLTPAIFLHELLNKARLAKRHIVLPEGTDPRILIAADYLLKRHVAQITLLGNKEKIHLLARRMQLDLGQAQIIDVEKSDKKAKYAKEYWQLRKHKNINLPIATERMADVNYFAAMMVYCGEADGMVSGAEHTTADTVRPALEIIKTKPGVTKVSSIFIMCMPTRVLIYGDCAINPEPDSQTLAEITLQAVQIAKHLGIEPKAALLSYSSGTSGSGKSVDKVVNAVQILQRDFQGIPVEGPMQYDAAVDPEVAAKKLPHSAIAGKANVLIFPDLNTGNNTYKAVQRETGALAIGPVLLGLNKPVNDLSRGCTPQDIINTILVTALQVEDHHGN